MIISDHIIGLFSRQMPHGLVFVFGRQTHYDGIDILTLPPPKDDRTI